MFIEEEIKEDKRPFQFVFAPGQEFIYKYFDREFDCRITDNPYEIDDNKFGVIIAGTEDKESPEIIKVGEECLKNGIEVVKLLVPDVIGTGMTGLMMRLARGVARGTMMQIKENKAVRSVIHATDIARVAKTLKASNHAKNEYIVSPPPVEINDLLEALSFRIKNKKLPSVSKRFARILDGKELFEELTNDKIADTSNFASEYQNFSFVNPVEYLKTHVYDEESL